MRAQQFNTLPTANALQRKHRVANRNRQCEGVIFAHDKRGILVNVENGNPTRNCTGITIVWFNNTQRVFRISHIRLNRLVEGVFGSRNK